MTEWNSKERIEKNTPISVIQLFQLPYTYFSGVFGNKKSNLLDCACGSMYQTFMLEDRFQSVFSVDKQIVRPGKNTYEIDLTQIGTLPFKDNFFDIVFSFETIEHLPEETHCSFVTELFRVGKKVVIGSISKDGPNYIQDSLIYKSATGTNPYHLKEYTSWEWAYFFSMFSINQKPEFYHSGFRNGMLDIISGINPANGFSNYVILTKEDTL